MVLWPRRRRVHAPMLVLGAEQDAFFTVDEVRRTARAYRTEAEIFPGMGHDVMLDTDWRNVADRIDAWMLATVAPASAASARSDLSGLAATAFAAGVFGMGIRAGKGKTLWNIQVNYRFFWLQFAC